MNPVSHTNYYVKPSIENGTALNVETRQSMPVAGKQIFEPEIIEINFEKKILVSGHMNPVGLGNYNNKGTQIIANEETQLGQNSSVMNNPSLIILKREQDLAAMASRENYERLQMEKQRLELETRRAELDKKRFELMQAALGHNL